MAGFSKRDNARIGRTVRDHERDRGKAGNGQSFHVGSEGFCVFVLVDPLYGEGRARASKQGHDITGNTWHTGSEICLIRGWKTAGKTWAAGKEGLCFLIGGRWFWMIPEDCGEDMDEADDTAAAAQETEYGEGTLT